MLEKSKELFFKLKPTEDWWLHRLRWTVNSRYERTGQYGRLQWQSVTDERTAQVQSWTFCDMLNGALNEQHLS